MATRPRWDVTVHADPFAVHHWSVWGGLVALAGQGKVRLRHGDLGAPAGGGLWLRVDDRAGGSRTIWVDVADRAPETSLRRDAAGSSWVRNAIAPVGRPLGFVAPLREGKVPRLAYLASATRVAVARRDQHPLRAALWSFRPDRVPLTYAEVEHPPGGDATVMFQVRCWEPGEGSNPADREAVNDTRAALIRSLRREFGPRFLGGFQPLPYAQANYPDCLATLPIERHRYIAAAQRCGVAVASTGLHGSLPWKLAEYAAMSRAVVAERNANAVPASHRGVFGEYSTVDECVAQCVALLEQPELRLDRQEAAARLWREHVRPDRLVARLLLAEFGED
ncbi:MAG: hypothetical protein ABMA25_03505 [Ilumatobacteraceae bacterium]